MFEVAINTDEQNEQIPVVEVFEKDESFTTDIKALNQSEYDSARTSITQDISIRDTNPLVLTYEVTEI